MVIVVAHADDEIIFGFPVIKEAKKIVCFSLPKNHSLDALMEVRDLLGVELVSLGRKPRTPLDPRDILKHVDGDVYTHNEWGEYGHPDHVRLNHIMRNSDKEVYTNDIAIGIDKVSQGDIIKEVKNDLELYQKIKNIYDKYNAWTWYKPPIKYTNLIKVRK